MKGITILGVLIAITVLAAIGSGMAVMVATNQEERNLQLYSDQSFASAQAGLEYTLGQEYNGVNPCDPLSRNLLGGDILNNTLTITRQDGRIYVVGIFGLGTTAVSMTDPNPPNGGQVAQPDPSHAQDAGNGAAPRKLEGVIFQLQPGCIVPVTITDLVISWEPDYGEKVEQIKMDGGNIYNGMGMLSGSTIDVDDQSVSDANEHPIDFIRWDNEIQDRLYTVVFKFLDGSEKSISIDLR